MSLQQLFDDVVTHARKQNKRAVDPNAVANGYPASSCLYRTPDGASCFFGALIPNDLYDAEMMEGMPARIVIAQSPLLQEYLITTYNESLDIISSIVRQLQFIHDDYNLDRWNTKFIELAKNFGLSYTPLEFTQ